MHVFTAIMWNSNVPALYMEVATDLRMYVNTGTF